MGIKLDTGTGTYSVSYSKRHPITRQPVGLKRKDIKSKAEANRVRDQLIILVNEKIKQRITPTWSCVVDEYFKSLPLVGVMSKTIYNWQKIVGYHTDIWNEKLVTDISNADILELINSKEKVTAESHRKNILSCIRKVFEYSLGRGYINRNPTPVIKFKINEKIKSVLTEPQIIKMLKLAQEYDWEWYPHVATAVYTGMRNGELYALEWDKVDLERRIIKVDCSWNNKDGFKSTKSGDDRVLEIAAPLLPLLQELKLKSAGSNFVLPRLSKWDKGEQARELRIFLKLVGLPEIRFHDLRASWATWLLGKGVVPVKVMAQGGWKDIKTMMIYLRKAGIDIMGSMSVLDNIQTHGIGQAEVIEFRPINAN